jgi:hypothetical protein
MQLILGERPRPFLRFIDSSSFDYLMWSSPSSTVPASKLYLKDRIEPGTAVRRICMAAPMGRILSRLIFGSRLALLSVRPLSKRVRTEEI